MGHDEQTFIWVVAILIGVGLVMFFRWTGRKRFLQHREPEELELIYSSEVNDLVEFDTFSKVLTIIGSAFQVDPKLLRPKDSLDELYALDSWDLDMGIEVVNRLLYENFGISQFQSKPTNLLELMIEVEKLR